VSGSVYYSPGVPRTEVTVRGACTPEGMSRSSDSISGGRDLVASPVRLLHRQFEDSVQSYLKAPSRGQESQKDQTDQVSHDSS
jgi:predicted HicB family RNase H-like nuclease